MLYENKIHRKDRKDIEKFYSFSKYELQYFS